MATVQEIDPRTARQWLDAGDTTLIDVREADENARERIREAKLMPLSRFNPSQVPSSGRLIVHCQGGARSMQAAQSLASAGREAVASLAGGINAWRSAGLPTEKDTKAPLPLQRQVHLVVGTLIIAASVFAATVSPWFLALTAFFGAGLLTHGATGFCGMGLVLARMPWNRPGRVVKAVNCGS